MKKILYIFLIIFPINNYSENFILKNNLTSKHHKKILFELSLKPIVLTLNIQELYLIFFMYIQEKQIDITNNLNAERNIYKKFNLLINWLEEQDDLIWYDYFSVHNQTISTLRSEIIKLINTSDFQYLCENIGEKMIDIIYSRIIQSYEGNPLNTNILSLIYIYQDYIKIFKDFITIDDLIITDIFNKLTTINEIPVSIIGSHYVNIESTIHAISTEIIASTIDTTNSIINSINSTVNTTGSTVNSVSSTTNTIASTMPTINSFVSTVSSLIKNK